MDRVQSTEDDSNVQTAVLLIAVENMIGSAGNSPPRC